MQSALLGDAPSMLALLGAIVVIFLAVGWPFLARTPWVLIILLVPATLTMMFASRLRMFVQGSRYDYLGIPYGEWAGQVSMYLLGAALIARYIRCVRTPRAK
jgi:cellulose synthase/poly-beta-1,6-N-acetylglucosamine synthase-like glycosyltransferase